MKKTLSPMLTGIVKKLILLTFVLVFGSYAFAQITVENPNFGYTTAGNLKLCKVSLTDSFTIVTFHVEFAEEDWIFIPKESYIVPVGSEEKLFVVKAAGIPLNERYRGGVADYDLYFPAISSETEKFDFGEANKGGNWFVFDIELKEGLFDRPLPKKMIGNWYASDGSRKVVLSLFDTLAVYNSQVWQYGQVKQEGGQYQIELMGQAQKLTIAVETSQPEGIWFTNEQQIKVELKDTPQNIQGYRPVGNEEFALPVFTKEEKSVYKGFIRNYSQRYFPKTGQVHVDNIITGKQESYTVNISPNGYFEAEFPLYYPHPVYVRMPMCNEAVFMEPGKEVFQLIDVRNSRSKNPFMGELAELNSEMMMLKSIQYFDYNKMQDTILKINPEEYKKFCFDIRDRELEELGKKAQTGNFSAKALQVKKIDIEYQAMVNAMSINMNYESSYRKKNKIPRQERELVIEIPKPDTTYYSFLSNKLVNNELALIAPSYKTFINRLKYLDVLRDRQENFNFTKSLVYLIEQKEIEPTEEEVLVINQMQALEQMINQEEWIRFFKNNIAGIQAFHKKHNELIDKMAKEDGFSFWHDIESVLQDNGIELLPEEKSILDTVQKIIPREAVQAQKQFSITHGEAQKAMQLKYSKQVGQHFRNSQSINQEKLMMKHFGIEKGLATNLFASQDICRGIVEETTPLDNDELQKMLKPVQIPFITEYIKASNEATKEKLKKNKEKTGYYVNQTPSVESEKLFDALMAKFKGKVVLVDFWATWCAPCRSGIERIKPLKEKMAGKNVVFVYVTNDSSPQKTWENMIPDIKGEHFKLTRDEWNALSARFNISGIPHYVLVDRNGEVANNNTLNTHNLQALKAKLEEFLQK